MNKFENLSAQEEKLIQSTLATKPKEKFVFENWSKTFHCTPQLLLAPSNENEVIEIINFARNRGINVKPIGSGFSPSDLACTEGIMMTMKNFNRVLKVDNLNSTITIESGITLHELHKLLGFWGLAFSSIGSISDQTISGVISTAAHGTGIDYGCFSSIVLDLVIIDGLGNRHYCSHSFNKDLFDAARCSLGALGVITQVTLQCEPTFKLKAVQVPMDLDEILNDLPNVLNSAEHVRFWWFPYTNDTVLWKASRTKEPKKPLKESFLTDKLYGFHYYQFQLLLSRLRPSTIPAITREHYKSRFNKRLEWVDDSHTVFNFDCLFPQYVNEWAIPAENTATALRLLRKWINKERESGGVHVHFPIEVRFVDQDDVWLSPCYKQPVCYIGVIMYRPFHRPVPYKKYWKAYEDIMRALGGRPHWAKAHQMYYFDLMKAYPKFPEFNAIREVCDPEGVFHNDYLRRHILPPQPDGSSGPLAGEHTSAKL
ncbi:hypothetical protein BB559_003902 [Furculomyces boomerangus]|uniref:D-arabinono-1,4-lactone oxidase n=2 Tax=Harpellales TaxID=61421 RepID=A0A2T9YI47_9FUNG|nr:hypothetical protein BB559_003902 [Furculomyces boomerangus]PVZ98443.1 hypothetical protein BB558_005551 [Smittium angustum]